MNLALDLNCDLGESESRDELASLMASITSASVACGGHAGTSSSMRAAARLARQLGVRLGAHPGLASSDGAGRGALPEPSPAALEALLLEQVGPFAALARSEAVELHHIKLHGSLYHASERHPLLARAYLDTVQRHWPHCRVFAFAHGTVTQLAPEFQIEVWGEAFADRAYQDDGTLLPRKEPGAVISNPATVLERVRSLCRNGTVQTLSGRIIYLDFRTICIHSDTPNAPALAAKVRAILPASA